MSRRAADWPAFLAAWIPYAVFAKAFWFVTDDSFISFRYSKNWAAGHGLRYNLGDHVPVEGFSNFLWVIWCGIVERLGGDVAFWAPLTSFATGSVLLWLVFRTLRHRFELDRSVSLLATLSLGAFAPYFVWSTGGLATMPFALAVFVAFERLVLRKEGPAPVAAGVAGLAAALIRVEGLAWVVLVAGGALITWRLDGKRSAAPLIRFALIVATGFALFLAWRYSTYGSLIANTAAAKVGLSAGLIARGLEYLSVYVLTFLTPLLLLPAYLVALTPERRAVGIPLVGLSAAAFGYGVAVGGDFMAMGRLFAPGLAFNALLFGWLLEWVRRRAANGARIVGAAVIALALLPAADFHLAPEGLRKHFNVREHWGKYWTETEYWNVMRLNAGRWKRLGLALREYAKPGSAVVAPGIGYIGYYSGLTVLDQAGLVDRDVAHRPTEQLTAPGHDKMVPVDYFLKSEPELMSPYLVVEGEELDRTLEALQRESDRLRAEHGVSYVPVRYVPFENGTPPPRDVPGAETALLANLLAPFGSFPGPSRPREVMLVLERDGG